jgi:DDE superfamily endonuclease/Helix-turn-helix of DDE superfamily endonuclease
MVVITIFLITVVHPCDSPDTTDRLADQKKAAENEIGLLRERLKEKDAYVENLQSKYSRLEEEYDTLKKDLTSYMDKVEKKSDFFYRCVHHPKWMHIYARFKDPEDFERIFLALEPCFKQHPKSTLCLREQFFFTLVKLTHNLTEEDLSFRFKVDHSTISRIFSRWINAMYYRLASKVIMWPKAENLENSMPMSFRVNYPAVCSIVDCFEIRVEKPHIPKEQAATFSSYKSMNTIKYLISITPQGTVSFVSQGYAGRVSDQHIIRVSGYLDLLKPGDCVMADRGFIVEEDVALRGAKLVTPAFLGRRDRTSSRN